MKSEVPLLSVGEVQRHIKRLEAQLRFTAFVKRGGIPLGILLVALGLASLSLCLYAAIIIVPSTSSGIRYTVRTTMLQTLLILLVGPAFLMGFINEAMIHFK